MQEQQVQLENGTTVTVKKLPLGKFGELLAAFEGAFEKFKSYPDIGAMKNNEFVALIPRLLTDALPEVEKALHVVADIPADYELGITEATDILVALIETNNIGKIFENIKKMMALRKKATPASPSSPLPSGSSESPTDSPTTTDGAEPTS